MPRNITQRISHISSFYSVLSDRLKRHRMMKSISRALHYLGSRPLQVEYCLWNIPGGCAETRCYYTPCLARHAVDVHDRSRQKERTRGRKAWRALSCAPRDYARGYMLMHVLCAEIYVDGDTFLSA